MLGETFKRIQMKVKDNIKMDLKETGWKGVYCVH